MKKVLGMLMGLALSTGALAAGDAAKSTDTTAAKTSATSTVQPGVKKTTKAVKKDGKADHQGRTSRVSRGASTKNQLK